MTTPPCQICLDSIGEDQLVTKICGKSCSAEICRQCMGRHVDVTLQQFFPGVLPRVRCPVCLILLHVSRWEDRVPTEMKATLTVQYSSLCSQTCTVTPPCCHKTDYSHLPEFEPYRKPASLIKLLPSQLKKFNNLCKQFCRHKLEPRTVLDYAFATFGEEKAAILVNELTLSNIQDAERRATLLLSLMYLRPNTKTNCCGHDFCFNCKRRGHHETCAAEFNEDNDLVRCRTCRALLLKVEGCDAVNCVCGFNMNWSRERALRQQHKKRLLPLDIFDIPLMNDWTTFRSRQTTALHWMRLKWVDKQATAVRPQLHSVFAGYLWRFRFRRVLAKDLSTAWVATRAKRVDQHLVAVGKTIRAGMMPFIWRFRLRKILTTQLSVAYMARRAKRVDQNLVVVNRILRGPVARYIWRCRFRKALASMEPVMYWKARRRWHPEELEAEAEEVKTLFSIGAFGEE